MSTSSASDAAAQATAAEAARAVVIELWTLYAIGVLITILRTYARYKAVGLRNFRPDDYLVWGAIFVYSAQSALAYNVGALANGLANNGMSDEARAALSPSDAEFTMRVIGSKIQLAGWTTYSALILLLKLSMLVFYLRLTEGLGRRYRLRIWIGFGLVIITFLTSILAVFLACIPFEKYWQINPNPGGACQPAISPPIIWASFSANIVTDIYLILIPIPLLWASSLRLLKKIASSLVLGAGIFVLVCATLKSVFVLVDPVNGAQLAGSWGTRETFVAVVTTNLPMIFPLLRTWLRPLFGSVLRSSHKTYKTPTGLRTIGGGIAGNPNSRKRRAPNTNPITTNATFTESEERIINDVKMQNLKVYATTSSQDPAPNEIVVSSEIEVTAEDRNGPDNEHQQARPVHEAW